MESIKIKSFLFSFFLLIIIQFRFSNFLYSQTFDQAETIINTVDSAGIRVIYQFAQKANKEDLPIIIKDTMALDIRDEWSCYYNLYKYKNDSLRFEKYKLLRETIQSVTVVKDPLIILELENLKTEAFDDKRDDSAQLFKNRRSNKIITFDKISEEMNAKFVEIIPPFEWTVKEDTSTILGYSCILASTIFHGRTYNVWFTPDIPINEGPWKLYDLPGLILKAETEDGLFQFSAIGIEKVKNMDLKFPDYAYSKNTLICKDLVQFHDLRRRRDKDILVGVFKERRLLLLNKQNPIKKNELELTP